MKTFILKILKFEKNYLQYLFGLEVSILTAVLTYLRNPISLSTMLYLIDRNAYNKR